MSIIRLVVPILLLAVLPAAGAVVSPTGEVPRDGRCDPSGVVVCVGADVGANAGCTITPAGVITCWQTYGWLTAAWSRLGLPGAETHVVDVTLSECSSVTGCASATTTTRVDCDWVALSACQDSQGFTAPGVTRQLVMGECLTVSTSLAITITGHVPDDTGGLRSVTFSNTGGHGAAECRLDDGRG